MFLATLMATGGGHVKYPPGQEPAPPQASADGKRGRKKEKQRARRNSVDPEIAPRPSSPPRRSAAASNIANDDFLRQLEQQRGKKKAKRNVDAPTATEADMQTDTSIHDSGFHKSPKNAAATTCEAPNRDIPRPSVDPLSARTAAAPPRSAAAPPTGGTEEDFHTCEDHMGDATEDESETHTSDSSTPVSSAASEPTVTVSLSQLSSLVSKAVVDAIPGILPQLASVLSPSRPAEEPKIKYADPEIFTGAKGQDAEAWYEDAKGLYKQRPPALKKMEFQRWLLNRVSEPIRTAFRAHVKDALQVDYQEVQDWTIPTDTLRKFLTGISTMGDSKHRIYEDLTALKWTPKFIQQSLLSVLPILARAGGDPAFTVSGHIVVSLICNALKLQYPSLYMHVFVDPETRAPYVDHVKFLKAVSLWHQSLRSVAGNGNDHGNGVPGAVGNGPDKPKTPKQIQNPHPKKIKPHKPHNNQNDYTQNDSPVKEWTAHKGPLSDELKAEIVSAGGCIFCKRKGHVIADCERRNKMKGNNKNRKK